MSEMNRGGGLGEGQPPLKDAARNGGIEHRNSSHLRLIPQAPASSPPNAHHLPAWSMASRAASMTPDQALAWATQYEEAARRQIAEATVQPEATSERLIALAASFTRRARIFREIAA